MKSKIITSNVAMENSRNYFALNKNLLKESLNEIASNKNCMSTNVSADGRYFNSDVLIARVNDPFGKSTKWELRNRTKTTTEDRSKRAVIELYSMIECSTGCNPVKYKAYGCYCGFLGVGVPVNGIDRCCQIHDKCYEHSNCVSYLEYFVPYVWKCYRGKPLCAINNGEWGGRYSCASRLCHCDLHLSLCLQRFICPKQRAVCTTSTARKLQNLLFIL